MNTNANSSDLQSGSAFIFPGQGSQTVGMGLDLYQHSPAARAIFDQMDDTLGMNLSKLIFEGPEDELRMTVNAQPAILATSLACLKATEEIVGPEGMPKASLMAGHSLGEYTALAASNAISISDAILLVRERGRLMQEAADTSTGGMTAIMGLPLESLQQICKVTNTEISNLNTPDQTVISGDLASVTKAAEMADASGARRTVQLPVAGAFHSRLMKPAQDGLSNIVATLQCAPPITTIVANTSGLPISSVEELKNELISGLCSCVMWTDSVQYMISCGINVFYEIGPGRALTGMVRRINEDATIININDLESIKSLLD